MVAHPTATEMTGGVHYQAMSSHIGMRLPSARIRVVVRGLEVSRTMFVTEAAISTITPTDDPLFKISDLRGIVTLHDRVLQKRGTAPELAKRYKVFINAGSSSKFSDNEQIKIESLTNHGQKIFVLLSCPKEQSRMECSTSWPRVAVKAGQLQNR